MTGETAAVEGLANVISQASWPDGSYDGFPTRTVAEMLAAVILASPWLAAHDAEVRREGAAGALREAADAVELASARNTIEASAAEAIAWDLRERAERVGGSL